MSNYKNLNELWCAALNTYPRYLDDFLRSAFPGKCLTVEVSPTIGQVSVTLDGWSKTWYVNPDFVLGPKDAALNKKSVAVYNGYLARLAEEIHNYFWILVWANRDA